VFVQSEESIALDPGYQGMEIEAEAIGDGVSKARGQETPIVLALSEVSDALP